MSLVTLETYADEKVKVNPDFVQSVTSYNHFDQDMTLPEEFLEKDRDGLMQVRQDKKEEADALRTSPRTLVLMGNGTSFEVKGSVDEVEQALAGK